MSGAGQIGTAVWVPPIGHRHLGAHRGHMSAGTNQRRRFSTGRFGAGQRSHVVYMAAVITPDRPCNHVRIAVEQGSGLKKGASARRRLTTSVSVSYTHLTLPTTRIV